MILVALETATREGSVALLRGERIVERECELRGEGALAALDRLLAEEGVRPGDLDAVAVSVGPGSFTGVRIGVAAAQGFAFALGIPLAAVGTLEGLAEAALDTDWGVPGALVLPLVDARRGEVYASLYRVGPPLTAVWGPETLSAGRLAEMILGLAPESARVEVGVLCGDGAALLAPFFPPGAGWEAPSILARPKAGAVARAGARKIARGETWNAETLQPVYLRKSDAEIVREKRPSSS